MLPTAKDPLSSIPQGKEKRVRPELRVNLFGLLDLLMKHLTPALCQTVFNKFRDTERERKWTFFAVAQFWTAMIIRHPGALQHGLDETRKGRSKDKLWPRVMATTQAFFEKCHALRPHLFQALYEAYTASLLPKAIPTYASWMKPLQKTFSDILIVDGLKCTPLSRQ